MGFSTAESSEQQESESNQDKMSKEILTTISPSTNQPVRTREGPTPNELSQIPKIAQNAFLTYRKTALSERQKIVKKALQIITERRHALAQELTEQMGRPVAYTEKEITTAVSRGEYMLKISTEALKDTPGLPEDGFQRWIRKYPLGPVLILFAWNVGAVHVSFNGLLCITMDTNMNCDSTHI